MHKHIESTLQAQTKAAIERMNAYFEARRRGAPRQERQKLEQEWLTAIRNMLSSFR
jgi:hypothetical protein